ncbi:hypothetical protein N7517_007780 [Penicillium concentricum]|uniref:Uncharacterized protein n=1 Tax=Penicillium concentricum TaxID=293559 RepID=A0A9W9VCL9_9EURO|nr:uncharacterized protein N7517_007780 [Penicillium concentricum]KAJ5375774.1 hypothetical protein N7517_007780 [Penicillium concentricum]
MQQPTSIYILLSRQSSQNAFYSSSAPNSSCRSLSIASCQVVSNPKPEPFTDFVNYILWHPAADAVQWHTLYARSLQLPDESLLITWENYPLEPPLVNHPIFRSVDGGSTWSKYSAVEDQVNGWGMRFQPFLYTLPDKFGGYAAGSVLAAGVSTPFGLTGGEPFLMFYEGKIVCFFSDQRDPAHSQKLIHVTTTDLLIWSADVPDVIYPVQGDRPGMTTVAHIEHTGKYIMTYEYCGTAGCAVHYNVAPSPLEFDTVAGIPLVSNDTRPITPYGSPYVIWMPYPKCQDGSGLAIVGAGNQEVVFVNEDAADADGWKTVNTGMWSAYSRSMRIVTIEGVKKLLFANGGNMGDPDNNSIACGVAEIPV